MKIRPVFLILFLFSLCGCRKTQSEGFHVTLLSDNSLEVEVSLSNPGTLGNYISPKIKRLTSILRVSGPVNGDDIETIREIAEFQTTIIDHLVFAELDLSESYLVAGGSYTYRTIGFDTINGTVVQKLDSITTISPSIPNEIPAYAFASLDLQSITVPNSVRHIGKNAFSFTYILNPISIPEGVTALQDSVFFEASQLPSITLPSTMESLGDCCFRRCLHLSEITVKAVNPPVCDMTLWDDAHEGTRTLHVPKGSIEAYRSHPVWGLADIITEIK